MKKKPFFIVAMTALLILVLGQTVFAFSDVAGNANEKKINSLKERGIISGFEDGTFKPDGELSYAEGISLIVKGFGLNLDRMRLSGQPLSDTYPNLSNDAWYSDTFVIAHHNNLDISTDVKASDIMTREQFAHHLSNAINAQGNFPTILPWIILEDEDEVGENYMNSIQHLLIIKVAELDKDGNFKPQAAITRGEAAGWLHDAIDYVELMLSLETEPVDPEPSIVIENVSLKVEAVNSDVNKAVISADVPHPGYGLRIASIVFEDDQAIITVEPTLPDPDMMYPQVITNVTVSTYVDAAFKPVLAATDSIKPQ